MAITYQATPTFTIDAVDLSAWVTAGAVTHTFENLDATTYAVDYRTFQPGLQSNSATITLFLDYAAAATYATLAPLVGTQVTIVFQPASGAQTATNPGFELTDTLFSVLPVINETLGTLSQVDLEFVGGSYAALV
jgi:hypothetical protein